MGERELAEDTGLAKSAYMSSESALRTELLLDDADDTDDTLLTLSDLQQETTGKQYTTQHAHMHRMITIIPGFPGVFPQQRQHREIREESTNII